MIDHAFVLAAGLGTRLKPYTDTLPKPMVPVAGRPLLDYIFDRLKEVGVHRTIINLHHKSDKIREFLMTRPDMSFTQSFEDELLDTGGGVKKTLSHLGNTPFYMINGDAFWTDADASALSRLAGHFDEDRMDILLLLQPVEKMTLTEGVGDYDLKEDGRALRRPEKNGKYMFAGVRIVHPRIFKDAPDGKFSFLTLMDKAEAEGRLYAISHLADWHHISTPADLEAVDAHIRQQGIKV